METQIEKLAKGMMSAALREEINQADEAKRKREAKEAVILESFKDEFKEQLPLLEEVRITFSAHFKTPWGYQGSYILFQRGEREVRMDFENGISYRYEYTTPNTYGRMVYGRWPKDRFIMYLYEHLF